MSIKKRTISLIIILILAVASLMACTASSTAGIGTPVVNTPTNGTPVVQPALLWSTGIHAAAQFVPYVAAGQGIVYYNYIGGTNQSSKLVAVRASDGTTIVWQKPITINYGAVPVLDGNLVFDTAFNEVMALNAHTGALQWSFSNQADLGSTYSTPTIVNGVVYFTSDYPGTLYALRESNGARLWSTQFGQIAPASGAVPRVENGAPLVANGVVYAGGIDGKWYAVNAANGQIEWTYRTLIAGQQTLWFTSGTIANGVVYFYSGGFMNTTAINMLYAIRLSNHSLLWKQKTLFRLMVY